MLGAARRAAQTSVASAFLS